jgi:hypothetical protein
MSGALGAALAGVAGVPLEGGGAEEVHLGPGAALDAVDGAGLGVREVGGAVAAVAGHELGGAVSCADLTGRRRQACPR